MEALSAEKWSLCLDSEGRVLDQYNVRKIVFHKGISEDIRHEVWPFLLGYYPFNSTSEERIRIDEEKRLRYESLLDSWRNSSNLEQFDTNFEEDAKTIEKDSRRTDRNSDFFSDDNIHNVLVLERLLKTFALLRPDIGYVQGMSDIMALPLMILNNEHQVFWCFDFIMKTTGRVFADLTLSEPLDNLAKLCQYIDKPLFDHLNQIYEGDQWLFAYRLVLLNFKRELSIDSCSRLWECYWSCHATQHFPLLFVASLLLHFRETLFKFTNFEQLMQFSQCLRGKIPVNEVLCQAIDLLEQLKSDELCPYDIKFLVSNEVSAPPPLVGFVRTRQRLTSLYSRKFDVQRDQIWRALFGDTPMQSITSPFMLSPPATNSDPVASDSNWSTPHHPQPNSSSESPLSPTNQEPTTTSLSSPQTPAPPREGFVPRGRNTFHLREDIRRLRLSTTYHDGPFAGDSDTAAGEIYSNSSTVNSYQISFGPSHVPPSVSYTQHENQNNRNFETQQSRGLNQLRSSSCDSKSHHLCSRASSSSEVFDDRDSQFDSLRSEAQLTCI